MSKNVKELSSPIQLLQQECIAIVERNQQTLETLRSEDAASLLHEVRQTPRICAGA